MKLQHLYSKSRISPLIQLFTQRAGAAEGCGDEAMRSLVKGLCEYPKRREHAARLDNFLVKRRILVTDVVSGAFFGRVYPTDGC